MHLQSFLRSVNLQKSDLLRRNWTFFFLSKLEGWKGMDESYKALGCILTERDKLLLYSDYFRHVYLPNLGIQKYQVRICFSQLRG